MAAGYKSMMVSAAWQDLERYAKEERDNSMKRIDCTPADELVIQTVCEERGIRKGIWKVIQFAQQRSEGV